ncbi:MAG: winged helix-turn-helix domain-containing protein [Tagaea sp.]|nr:winged helix-turn-helix domain-containing protein [Tagaea sp.]
MSDSPISDPYAAVLADLRVKRDKIDQMISSIEAFRGQQGATVASGDGSGAGPAAPTDGPGAFLGMSIADAAKKLLSARRQPLKNADIVLAFKAGGLVLNSAEPANTVGSVLNRRFTEVGDIVRIDRGTWGLKEWYPNRTFKKKGDDADTSSKSGSSAQ